METTKKLSVFAALGLCIGACSGDGDNLPEVPVDIHLLKSHEAIVKGANLTNDCGFAELLKASADQVAACLAAHDDEAWEPDAQGRAAFRCMDPLSGAIHEIVATVNSNGVFVNSSLGGTNGLIMSTDYYNGGEMDHVYFATSLYGKCNAVFDDRRCVYLAWSGEDVSVHSYMNSADNSGPVASERSCDTVNLSRVLEVTDDVVETHF
ncbi:MAG: hypothetical protein ABII07_06140 [Patescibacteria group bacterium]|nr:hypothetical protein [Patescibacteria group bacterium]